MQLAPKSPFLSVQLAPKSPFLSVQLAPKSPFLSVEESTKASKNHSSVAESKLDSDDDVIGLPPELDSRARSETTAACICSVVRII